MCAKDSHVLGVSVGVCVCLCVSAGVGLLLLLLLWASVGVCVSDWGGEAGVCGRCLYVRELKVVWQRDL